MLGLKIGIIKRPHSAPKPVRAGEGSSVIHSGHHPLPTQKGSPWQAINPCHYSPSETRKGAEKGNCNENGSKKGKKKKRKRKHNTTTKPSSSGEEQPSSTFLQTSPLSFGHHQDPPRSHVSNQTLISDQLSEKKIPQGSVSGAWA